MIRLRIPRCVVLALACSATTVQGAAAQTQAGDPPSRLRRFGDASDVVVPLTDPSRPAVLSVTAFSGDIVVRGTSRRDVLVRSSSNGRRAVRGRRPPEPPPPGMRRLTPDGGFLVEERNNEVSVEGASCGGFPGPNPNPDPGPPDIDTLSALMPRVLKGLPCGPTFDNIDFEIEVPLKTNLKLSSVTGDIAVTSVEGALEVNSMNGDLSLTAVAGSVVAHTVNGDVMSVLTRADAEAPMAFTTLNGEVDVTLPASIRASLKLRTDNGDVFTDFDIPAPQRPAPRGTRQRDGRFRFEVERAILASLNGGGPDIELRSFNGRVYLRRGK